MLWDVIYVVCMCLVCAMGMADDVCYMWCGVCGVCGVCVVWI
jgi:hypothetical protein